MCFYLNLALELLIHQQLLGLIVRQNIHNYGARGCKLFLYDDSATAQDYQNKYFCVREPSCVTH